MSAHQGVVADVKLTIRIVRKPNVATFPTCTPAGVRPNLATVTTGGARQGRASPVATDYEAAGLEA